MKVRIKRKGSSSILVILTFLLLMVFSVLGISSSYADYRLAQKNADYSRKYYLLEGQANELLWAADKILIEDKDAELSTIKNGIKEIYPQSEVEILEQSLRVSQVFENDEGLRLLMVLELDNEDRSGFELRTLKSIPKTFEYNEEIQFEDLEVFIP